MERLFKRDPDAPFVASQSALGTLMSCEQKFVHRYVLNTERDANWVRPTYFSFGSAFHEILYFAKYNRLNMNDDLIKSHVEVNGLNWDTDGAKLKVMLESYFVDNPRKETYVAGEVEIITQDFVMYADAIFKDEHESWYIADMKTVGIGLDEMIKFKLRNDPQMCLYAKHADLFAEKLGLDPAKFIGMSYRELEKPRQRIKKGETHDDFASRIGSTVYRETFLTPDMLNIEQTMFNMHSQLVRARSLKSEKPMQNTNNCKRNGLVCEFWSQCYGAEYGADNT